MALPNLWGLYNLRSSPCFQATLRSDTEATPVIFFTGWPANLRRPQQA